MGRPNFDVMARQQRAVASFVGETAIWRQYVSADVYNPSGEAAGYGLGLNFANRVITGLFAPIPFPEIAQAGGLLLTGDMNATLMDALPSPNDTIQWRGVDYRVVSDTLPQRIVGSSALRFVLRRAQPTGG